MASDLVVIIVFAVLGIARLVGQGYVADRIAKIVLLIVGIVFLIIALVVGVAPFIS